MRKPKGPWFWSVVVWSCFGLTDATHAVISMRTEGMHHAWLRLFFALSASWLVWMLATPAVIRIVRRFPPSGWRPISTWFVHLAACAGVSVAYALWTACLQTALQPWLPDFRVRFVSVALSVISDFYVFIILYVAILAVGYGLASSRKLAEQETVAAQLSAQLSRAQLEALRGQLEPHFLFNALNAISGLIRDGRNDTAVDMISGLSELLRRALDRPGDQQVALGEEMEFLEKYLEIQKLRFAERLQVSLEVPPDLASAQVPSLILQPVVENAIRHGVEKLDHGGLVRVTAARSNGHLTLNIYNEGPSLRSGWEQANTGIGISNVRARLRGLYGDACSVELRNHEAGGVETSLSFPYSAGPK